MQFLNFCRKTGLRAPYHQVRYHVEVGQPLRRPACSLLNGPSSSGSCYNARCDADTVTRPLSRIPRDGMEASQGCGDVLPKKKKGRDEEELNFSGWRFCLVGPHRSPVHDRVANQLALPQTSATAQVWLSRNPCLCNNFGQQNSWVQAKRRVERRPRPTRQRFIFSFFFAAGCFGCGSDIFSYTVRYVFSTA